MTPPPPETGKTAAPFGGPELDDFERGLLPVLRHFILSFAEPERQSWQHAYFTAIERWGHDQGLVLAHLAFRVVKATLHCRPEGLAFNDPLDLSQRSHTTCDELALLRMLHHMRRDNTPGPRRAINLISGDHPDAHLIQAGLTLANRFPAGHGRCHDPKRPPLLRVVK